MVLLTIDFFVCILSIIMSFCFLEMSLRNPFSQHQWRGDVDLHISGTHTKYLFIYLSRLVTKSTKWHVRQSKTQFSLGIRPVWLESSLCAQWIAKDPRFLHADSEDSDQTRWMPRLICVFAGRTCHFVGFVMRRLIYSRSSAVSYLEDW